MKKKVYRNTAAFKLLAWGSFALFVILILIGLYTLKEPLIVCSDLRNIDFSNLYFGGLFLWSNIP